MNKISKKQKNIALAALIVFSISLVAGIYFSKKNDQPTLEPEVKFYDDLATEANTPNAKMNILRLNVD